jgi:hypothetical protein
MKWGEWKEGGKRKKEGIQKNGSRKIEDEVRKEWIQKIKGERESRDTYEERR